VLSRIKKSLREAGARCERAGLVFGVTVRKLL